MSFDRATRNLLAAAVGKIRERLKTDVMDELRRLGFQDDGTVLDLASIGGLTEREHSAAEELRALLRHLIAAEGGADGAGTRGRSEREVARAAYDRMAREVGFTTLNRLVALRMAEERKLILQSVGAGLASTGFQIYERLANGALGGRHESYRAYLECLYDEIGRDLPALFDRTDPHSRIFPGERCLEDVLAQLNRPDLAHLWGEDETIGWVYQYYNDPDERKKMRESQAPRTSRELAVRNQFFTPRYVVEFLTDNTLGRTWYEMRRGETRLVDECRYMVRRKRPVFMAPGEEPPRPWGPEDGHTDADSAGELWTRPNPELTGFWDILTYGLTIGYDYARQTHGVEDSPRWFRAIAERLAEGYRSTSKWEGSFEELRASLFVQQRSWAHADAAPSDDQETALRALNAALCAQWDLETEYIPYRAAKDPRDLKLLDPACGSAHFLLYAFDLLASIYEEVEPDLPRERIPALILRHNLHGIDIDPRAVQIACLALFFKARKYDRDARIESMNIVCAAPMPGERGMFDQFLAALDSPTVARIAEVMWEELALAGVAGSLLKPEVRLRKVVAEQHALYTRQRAGEQQLALMPGQLRAEQLPIDFSDISDDSFWDDAEERILAVLREYSEQAEGGDATSRRLFAGDGTQGFRFVDVLRKQYDVVLMNPPFGETSAECQNLLDSSYPSSRSDLATIFVDIGLRLAAPYGSVGAITTRTVFLQPSSELWRTRVLASGRRVNFAVDLGYNVLDTAVVETAAYIVTPQIVETGVWVDVQDSQRKESEIYGALSALLSQGHADRIHVVNGAVFSSVPSSPFCYSLPRSIILMFRQFENFEESGISIRCGMGTLDDYRFLRAWWETNSHDFYISGSMFQEKAHWVAYAKGGTASPFYSPIPLVVNFFNSGLEVKSYVAAKVGSSSRKIQSEGFYYLPGLTFGRRIRRLSPAVLPKGCIFSDSSNAVFVPDSMQRSLILSLLNGYAVRWIISHITPVRKMEVGVIQRFPLPAMLNHTELHSLATRGVELATMLATWDEVDKCFTAPSRIIDQDLEIHKRLSGYYLRHMRNT